MESVVSARAVSFWCNRIINLIKTKKANIFYFFLQTYFTFFANIFYFLGKARSSRIPKRIFWFVKNIKRININSSNNANLFNLRMCLGCFGYKQPAIKKTWWRQDERKGGKYLCKDSRATRKQAFLRLSPFRNNMQGWNWTGGFGAPKIRDTSNSADGFCRNIGILHIIILFSCILKRNFIITITI